MFIAGIFMVIISIVALILVLIFLGEDANEPGAAIILAVCITTFGLGVLFVNTQAPTAIESKRRAMEYLKDYKRQVDDAEEDVRVNKIIQEIKDLNLKGKN